MSEEPFYAVSDISEALSIFKPQSAWQSLICETEARLSRAQRVEVFYNREQSILLFVLTTDPFAVGSKNYSVTKEAFFLGQNEAIVRAARLYSEWQESNEQLISKQKQSNKELSQQENTKYQLSDKDLSMPW